MEFKPYYRFLLILTRSILAAQESVAGVRKRAFSSAREELRKARVQRFNYRKIPELRRAYLETVWQISRDIGGVRAMVWRFWRLLAG